MLHFPFATYLCAIWLFLAGGEGNVHGLLENESSARAGNFTIRLLIILERGAMDAIGRGAIIHREGCHPPKTKRYI